MGEKTFGMHSLVSAEILNNVSTEQLLLSVMVTPWIPGDNPTLIGLADVPSDHKISYGGIPPSAVTSSSKSVFEISHSIRRSKGDNVNLISSITKSSLTVQPFTSVTSTQWFPGHKSACWLFEPSSHR